MELSTYNLHDVRTRRRRLSEAHFRALKDELIYATKGFKELHNKALNFTDVYLRGVQNTGVLYFFEYPRSNVALTNRHGYQPVVDYDKELLNASRILLGEMVYLKGFFTLADVKNGFAYLTPDQVTHFNLVLNKAIGGVYGVPKGQVTFHDILSSRVIPEDKRYYFLANGGVLDNSQTFLANQDNSLMRYRTECRAIYNNCKN